MSYRIVCVCVQCVVVVVCRKKCRLLSTSDGDLDERRQQFLERNRYDSSLSLSLCLSVSLSVFAFLSVSLLSVCVSVCLICLLILAS